MRLKVQEVQGVVGCVCRARRREVGDELELWELLDEEVEGAEILIWKVEYVDLEEVR